MCTLKYFIVLPYERMHDIGIELESRWLDDFEFDDPVF